MNSVLLLGATTLAIISTFITVDFTALFFRLSDQRRSLLVDDLQQAELVPIPGAVGPESFAFDRYGGGPYAGVSDGRILKWIPSDRRWVDFAVTSSERENCGGVQDHELKEEICGRPLGLRFDEDTDNLYIGDAYMGLMKVGPEGGVAQRVATEAEGLSLRFTNGLAVDPRTGIVYFTDSSSHYRRRDYVSVILSGDTSGRLLKYDSKTQQTTVLLNNLSFPNGVELSNNGDFVLVAETSKCRILKYFLRTRGNKTVEVFAQVPGFPDNIKKNGMGDYWVGLHTRRKRLGEWILSSPWLGKTVLNLMPGNLINPTRLASRLAKWRGSGGLAVRLSEDGEIMEVLEDKGGRKWGSISEVLERNGEMWIGSVSMPYAGIYRRCENQGCIW